MSDFQKINFEKYKLSTKENVLFEKYVFSQNIDQGAINIMYDHRNRSSSLGEPFSPSLRKPENREYSSKKGTLFDISLVLLPS